MRERLLMAYNATMQKEEVEKDVLSRLQKSTDEILATISDSDKFISDVERDIADICDNIQNLLVARNNYMRELNSIQDVIITIARESEVTEFQTHELAHLTTVIQYFDVAAKSSPDYWAAIMGIADIDTIEKGFGILKNDDLVKFNRIYDALLRVREDKSG